MPETLDVVVTLNLYGDILSDVAAQVAGSVGLAGSANIGREAAMFEAVHGSAPDIAGKDVANPSGLLTAAAQMLVHVGLPEFASRIKNAWLCTLEEGIHTADIYREGLSRQRVGTRAFASAVIDRLFRVPQQLQPVKYTGGGVNVQVRPTASVTKQLVGVDVFLDWTGANRDPDVLGRMLEAFSSDSLRLKMVTNRGVKVFPEGMVETFCTDHWRCRFVGEHVTPRHIINLLQHLVDAGLDVIKTENLYTFDGEPGYSLGQGE